MVRLADMKSVQVAFAGRAELAEGPIWYEDALWWVNIAVGTLNRWDPRTGFNTSRATAGFLGAATPCRDGRWLLARQRDCIFLDWQTGEHSVFARTPAGLHDSHRFNDGKCGPAGNFWVGTMSLKQRPHEAALYVLSASGEFHRDRARGHSRSGQCSRSLSWPRPYCRRRGQPCRQSRAGISAGAPGWLALERRPAHRSHP